jgi:Formate/nitrite transporter
MGEFDGRVALVTGAGRLRGEAHILERVGQPVERLAQLTWAGFVLHNLIPVTLGNLVGGVVMVAAVYWFVYLRGKPGNRVVWTWQHLTHALVEAGRSTNDRGESHHDH